MAGQHIDLTSDPFEGRSERPQAPGESPARRERPFLGITFACCDIYARVYVNDNTTAYEGRCPKCFRPIRIGISPDGQDGRFFTAY